MRESSVQYLVCPDTQCSLQLEGYDLVDGDVVEGELIPTGDVSRRYLIRGGVPRFVDMATLSDDQRETIEAFAYKWSKIPYYAHEPATKRQREGWYFERFGFTSGDEAVRAFLRSAQYVLEVGTGTGVDTDLLVRNFDGLVFGVDISGVIDLAYAQLRERERVVLLQADLARLPFRPGFFDVISCDQVLHHTPDPPGNFRRLVHLLRPGGHLLLYVYRIKGPLREFADDYLRRHTTRAALDDCLDFTEQITRLGRALSRLQATVQIEDDIPALGIRKGTYDVQRLIYDHVVKCFWNEAYDFQTNMMINFDWYRPLHAFRYGEGDIRVWCQSAGVDIQHMDVSASGISTIIHKPELRH